MMLSSFLAHPDARVARGNLIAMVLAWNTPFYPLYLRWMAGAEAWPVGWATLGVLPFFLAIPLLARRRPLLARVALFLVGFGNVLFCTWLLGEGSGTELFLLPCLLLPGLLFGRGQERVFVPLLAVPLLAYYLLHGHYPAPPLAWSGEASREMLALNAGSVGCLIAFFALLVARSVPDQPGEPVPREGAKG